MSKPIRKELELQVDNRGTLYPTQIQLDGDWIRITQTYKDQISVVALDNNAMTKLVEVWMDQYCTATK